MCNGNCKCSGHLNRKEADECKCKITQGEQLVIYECAVCKEEFNALK